MVNHHGLVVYANQTFQKVLGLQKGEFLPKDLVEMLNREADEPSLENMDSLKNSPAFYSFDDKTYRLSWAHLKSEGEEWDQCRLLRMYSAVDPYSQSALAMMRASLTPREIEVTTLICDGIMNDGIASRLFISEHTVKNHLKSIYTKFDVHNRNQLTASLKTD
jgi:DNA-binding CsgD family transcriptional regulator